MINWRVSRANFREKRCRLHLVYRKVSARATEKAYREEKVEQDSWDFTRARAFSFLFPSRWIRYLSIPIKTFFRALRVREVGTVFAIITVVV